jgi:hypothetical protein
MYTAFVLSFPVSLPSMPFQRVPKLLPSTLHPQNRVAMYCDGVVFDLGFLYSLSCVTEGQGI